MRSIVIWVGLICSVLWIRCNAEDSPSPSYLWKYPLRDVKDVQRFHHAQSLPAYENIVVMFGQKNGKMMFYGIDAEKGTLVWENSDFNDKNLINGTNSYTKSYVWVFEIDGTKLYGMDVRTGKVLWSSGVDGVEFNVSTIMDGNGDYFYCQGTEKIIGKQGEGYVDRPWRGNVFTGVIERIPSTLEMSTDFKCEGSYGSAFAIPVLSDNPNEEKIMLSIYDKPKEEGYTGCNFDTQEGEGWHLGLYDVKNNTWIYKHNLNVSFWG